MAEEDKKITKKMGNPNWHKGMAHPEGAGRPKGLKDSVFAPRQKKKHDALFWRQMEESALESGFVSLADWLWKAAQDNLEWKALLMERILAKLGADAVGETQERLALSGMLRDVMASEASAEGATGGQTINIITGGGIMAPTESMREIDRIEAVDVKALPVDDESEEAEEG